MDIEEPKKNSYLDEYRIIRTLGSGYHAKVRLGVNENGQYVAIKQYKQATATLDTLKHELGIMKDLHHENLVNLISVRENAVYKKPDETTYNCFAIVLEYVGGGELFDFIAETDKFSQKISRTYFHQLMSGLHYLHGKGYAHRDIKPENILLSENFVLKLADFGFSCLLKGKDGKGILKTKLGTEGYMAPEIPMKKYEGKTIDIFACGVILFIMYAGNPPFEKAAVTDPYYKTIAQKKFDVFWQAHSRKRQKGYFSESFRDLFTRMVAYDPAERISIEQIAVHPWVKEQICTYEQIQTEFKARQIMLNKALEIKRAQQQAQKQAKLNAAQSQGGDNRSVADVDMQFLETYNNETIRERKFAPLEAISTNDIEVRGDACIEITTLKEFLKRHQVRINDLSEFSDETDLMKATEISQEKDGKFIVKYSYSYEIGEETVNASLETQVQIGKNKSQNVVFRFQLLEGESLYFKKIVKDIKKNCFA